MMKSKLLGFAILFVLASITKVEALDFGGVINGLKLGLGDREKISNEDKLLNSIDFQQVYVSKRQRDSKTLEIWSKVKKEANFIELERVRNIPDPSLLMVIFVNIESPVKGEDGYLELWEINNHIYDDQVERPIKSTATRYLVFCEQGLLLNAANLTFNQQMAEGDPKFINSHGISIIGDKAKAFKIYRKVCAME